MKKSGILKAFGAFALLGAGVVLAGCKSAPDLTQAQALTLLQAYYAQQPPQSAAIVVNDAGMGQAALAKLWERTKVYPNHYWADFKLTDAGKKAVKLDGGGDTIEWRPENAADTHHSITLTTVAVNPRKVRDLGDVTDEMIAGMDTARGGSFVEAVDLTGVPDVLQQIAHTPGNQLGIKRHVDFALVNGAWTVHGVQ